MARLTLKETPSKFMAINVEDREESSLNLESRRHMISIIESQVLGDTDIWWSK